MTNKLVLCRDHRQFIDWIVKNELNPNNFICVVNERTIIGKSLGDAKLILLGNWWENTEAILAIKNRFGIELMKVDF